MEDKKFEHGQSYEIKILTNLINEENFLIRVIDHLKPEYFNFPENTWMMEYIESYFKKYSSIPTYETVLIELKKSKLRKSVRDPIVMLAHKTIKSPQKYLKDSEKIQESVIDFCKSRAYENAMLKSADLVSFGKFDEINSLWEEAKMVGEEMYLGVDVDDLEDRKHNEVRKNTRPFFSPEVTSRIGGGLGGGEFMVIIAPMGAGKTMLATKQASFNRTIGTTTLFVTLELKERNIRHRIDACLLEKSLEETKNPKDYEEEIQKRIAELDNGSKIIIEHHSSSGTNAFRIKNRIKVLRSRGIIVEQVIIDYLDVMDCNDPKHNYKKDWEKFEYVSRDLYSLAQELDISVVAFVQGNTTSIDLEVISAKSTSGGAKRLHPADIIMGYARPPHFKEQEKANLSFIKNRFGRDGFILPCVTDYSRAKIEVLGNESYALVEEKKTDEEISESMKRRYERFSMKKKSPENDGSTII